MFKSYIKSLFIPIVSAILLSGCNDDYMGFTSSGEDGAVTFEIEIDDADFTRGIMEDSKTSFDVGELIHIQAVFRCKDTEGKEFDKVNYGILKYADHGKWEPYSSSYALAWPYEAISGTFTAYYLHGSTGAMSENTMDPILLSDFKFREVPLNDKAEDIRYGQAVKLRMKHVFSYLTLTDIQEGIANEFWFTVPDLPMERDLNNAFRLRFDERTKEITEEFLQVPSEDYKDSNGKNLVFIKSKGNETPGENDATDRVSFFLQPGVYHQFNLLYPRGRDIYATYLTYNRNLALVTGEEGLKANARYLFSILKSLGIIVEETPDDGWDEKDPTVIIDVEKFLRAVNSGSDYFEEDPETGEEVQILESTIEGTKLLTNVDFRYFYYDVFADGNFKPVVNKTFDGNYHYIYHLGCPLFYQNDGIIMNLGIRDSQTKTPIISSENRILHGQNEDMSYNGIIVSRNIGTIINMRIVNVDMTVHIQTSDPDDRTQEAHNVSLLFGVNRGNIYDLGLSGNLTLKVENAPDEDIIPRISIGGIAGQNLGTFSGISYIDDEDFSSPVITVFNNCRGENGAYKVGGIAGNNMGNLDNIFLPSVIVDASRSSGLESYLGGMVGENPNSTAGAPKLSGCIIRGKVTAGETIPVINLNSLSYAGGVAGSFNLQSYVENCSVSVDVSGAPGYYAQVDYAEGGAFGILEKTVGYQEGKIQTLACYGARLQGNEYKGNFAGTAPSGFGWDHYQNNDISVKNLTAKNIGLIR